MIDQRKFFYKEVLMPTFETSKRTLGIFDLIEITKKTEKQHETAQAIHNELRYLVIEFDKLTLTEANERFKNILKNNVRAKQSLYRSVVTWARKAYNRRMGAAGKHA